MVSLCVVGIIVTFVVVIMCFLPNRKQREIKRNKNARSKLLHDFDMKCNQLLFDTALLLLKYEETDGGKLEQSLRNVLLHIISSNSTSNMFDEHGALVYNALKSMSRDSLSIVADVDFIDNWDKYANANAIIFSYNKTYMYYTKECNEK